MRYLVMLPWFWFWKTYFILANTSFMIEQSMCECQHLCLWWFMDFNKWCQPIYVLEVMINILVEKSKPFISSKCFWVYFWTVPVFCTGVLHSTNRWWLKILKSWSSLKVLLVIVQTWQIVSSLNGKSGKLTGVQCIHVEVLSDTGRVSLLGKDT